MNLLSIKFLRIIMLLGFILSLGLNNYQVNATSNNPPVITTIDRTLDVPFSVTTQDIGVARTQKVSMNAIAFEKIAQNLFS